MSVATQGAETRIRSRIAEIVGPQRFKVWFKSSTRMTCADGFLKVGVPNLFIGNWIESHFAEPIAQAARDVLGKDIRVTFGIDPHLFRNLRKNELDSQAAFIEKNAERSVREARKRKSAGPDGPRRLRGRLEDFVVGPPNQLAFSVARSIVDQPDGDRSPVFFHGACGLGKTHLLQGVTNGLSERQPQVRWVYASGEEFTNQFLFALRQQRLDGFRHRYRHVDILLVDDVHFLANKKATQEEFLHTFNAIAADGMRVIAASDAHPRMIGDLSPSLVNRFLSGMVVRIDRPDFQTRCEILLRRAAATQQSVPEPVIAYIAEKIHANVRELEGCLLKLVAYAALVKLPITPALARQVLEEHVVQTGKILSVSDIESIAATFFGLTPADLHTSRKTRTIALARNVAMFLARKHTELSFPEIGRLMGGKDHSTVLYACERLQNVLDRDGDVLWQSAAGPQTRKLRDLLEQLEDQLRK